MHVANKNKSYRFGNHLTFSCQYHVVFCPKYRRKVLEAPIAAELETILRATALEMDAQILEMQVMLDHVHILLDVNPQVGVIKVVKAMKGASSNILRKKFPKLKSRLPCLWSRNKFISSVGEVGLDVIKKYIEDQKNV